MTSKELVKLLWYIFQSITAVNVNNCSVKTKPFKKNLLPDPLVLYFSEKEAGYKSMHSTKIK